MAAPQPPQSKPCGDVNNGDHPVGLASGPLFVAKDTGMALLSYVIYNGTPASAGIDLAHVVQETLDEYTKQILEGGPSSDPSAEIPDDPALPDNATFTDTGWLNVLELAAIGSLISPDCDGVVAADVIGRTKSQLDSAIDAAGGTKYVQSRRYPGTDSPAGCGSNSDYTVTWSVTRQRESGSGPFSVRAFLSQHQLTPSRGVRSFGRPGQSLSIRDLVT